MKGLEPPRPETLDPKSNAATNYATCAVSRCKVTHFFSFHQHNSQFLIHNSQLAYAELASLGSPKAAPTARHFRANGEGRSPEPWYPRHPPPHPQNPEVGDITTYPPRFCISSTGLRPTYLMILTIKPKYIY